MRALYRGFSLHQLQKNGSTKLADLDLVKMNLLTHIYTSRGERLNMTTFGTRIPGILFEQLDHVAIEVITEDLMYVFGYDPRVRLNDLKVTPVYERNAILAQADVTYLELNITEPFVINLQFQ